VDTLLQGRNSGVEQRDKADRLHVKVGACAGACLEGAAGRRAWLPERVRDRQALTGRPPRRAVPLPERAG
jgi:hypothetical protein